MICIGNWKMNQTPEEVSRFIQELKTSIRPVDQQSVALLVPALYFSMMKQALSGTSIQWGGQNCYFEDRGAFTGENSPQLMYELGASYCLVGHSERRTLFQETNAMIQKKFQAIIRNQITPILCIGETLEERNQGKTHEVLKEQLQNITSSSSFLIAYEPVWAIGSGRVASVSQIQEAIHMIRPIVTDQQVFLLYGGSVCPEQSKELSQIKGLDGFLVGTKSLVCKDFIHIYQNSQLT